VCRLREALNLAVDRDVLVSKIDVRGEQPAFGILPPVITDYTGQAMAFRGLSRADRFARAKQLMAAAGY
jgi:oligopeptide transport system substrate-binding protein